MKSSLLFSLSIWLISITCAFGQKEIFGGNLHVEQIGDCNANKIRVEAQLYLLNDPAFPIPDSITVHWGDGVSKKIAQSSNGNFPGQITYLNYIGEHTYDGPGSFSISIEDCCLTESFINFDSKPPVSLKLNAVYSMLNGQLQGCNSTAKLTSPLVDFGYVGQLYHFNPAAYDPDGDSMVYSIYNPQAEFNYHFPDEIMPSSSTEFSINQQTGTITWDKPTKAGNYLVGLKVEEFRKQGIIAETFHLLGISIFDIDISLFPNPTASVLTVNLSPAVPNEKLQVKIYNVLGQVVIQEAGVFTSTGYQIDVYDFANGIYLLEVEAVGRNWIRKFVKV